jgi:hypothetical protein
MAFLRDCAVVVLMTGFFVIPKDIQCIHDCYTLQIELLTVKSGESSNTV